MSASVIATELKLPLYTVVLDNLITRYMERLRPSCALFLTTSDRLGLFIFDEFDAIGTQRGAQNDVGEIRRVLNSFDFVEQDDSESIVLAATNHPELLDRALYRRFDDIILFTRPEGDLIRVLIEQRLAVLI